MPCLEGSHCWWDIHLKKGRYFRKSICFTNYCLNKRKLVFLHWKHSVEGSPPHPVGHLQTALWPVGVHWAFFPQGKPLSHGLTHWCWLQALLSGHSESVSHSPILTAEKILIRESKFKIKVFFVWKRILTWWALCVRISSCPWGTSANCSMICYRAPCWLTARIVCSTWVHTTSWNTCLEWGTLIIRRTASFNGGS